MTFSLPKLEESYKGQDHLEIVAEFPHATPETLFRFWTDPSMISKWWPPEARIEARPGGAYVMSWPRQNWVLRGTFTRFDPEKFLSFTWAWDHEPEEPSTEVQVMFEPFGAHGTHLTLRHGGVSA